MGIWKPDLIIRKEHVDQFSHELFSDYVVRSMHRLRIAFPEYFYDSTESDVRLFIESSIRLAGEFGLEMESTVGRFIDYRLIFGLNFENASQRHWLLEALSNPDKRESEKIYEIDMILFGYSLEPEPYV